MDLSSNMYMETHKLQHLNSLVHRTLRHQHYIMKWIITWKRILPDSNGQ